MTVNPFDLLQKSSPENLRQELSNFQENFARNNPGISPYDKVMELLNSGKMSLQQFETLRGIANTLFNR